MKQSIRFLTLIVATAIMLAGCASSSDIPNYQTVRGDPNRDSEAAQRANQRAVKLLEENKYDEAEGELKQALAADIAFGIAHNNLGKVYYHQSKLYLAAWEFQYAIKLMPNQPEPRNNLGLVFEAVGKLDEAVTSYDQAVGLEPDNPQLIGNLVRARYRRGDRDTTVRTLLSDLIMRDTRPEWVQWARGRLALMPTAPPQVDQTGKEHLIDPVTPQ